MGGSGSKGGGGFYTMNPSKPDYMPDQQALETYINSTDAGKQYSDVYSQTKGQGFFKTTSGFATSDQAGNLSVSSHLSDMLNSFQAWQSDQNNAESSSFF